MKQIYTMIIGIVWGTACQAQTMTLPECIQRGLAANLSICNARIDREKGRTGISQSRARLLPVIQGTVQLTGYLKSPVNVTTGTQLGHDFPDEPTWQTIKSMPYNSQAGIQLTMPLYNQTLYAAIEVARTMEKIHSLSFRQAEEELTVQISRIYYLAQAAQEQQRLTEQNISHMEELYNITEALYRQGMVMEVDLNRVRINLQTLHTQRDQQATLYEQHLNMLRFLMDLPLETPLEMTAMNPWMEPPSHQLPVNGLLPELQLAERQKELAEKRIRTVRAGYLPTLSLTGYAGAIGYQEQFGHFLHSNSSHDNWFGNCYLAITLRIPLFEANSRKLQIRQYRYEAQQAANRQEQLRKQLNEHHALASLQLNHNLEVWKTQTENLRQAEGVYRVTAEQYKEGIASMTTLLQDEMQLRTAQAACIQAHCQCDLARLDLLKLAGQLDQLSR